MRKHLLISDTQCKPDEDTTYLRQIGKLIVDERPDVIVHIGDHFDMPSLSSYDMGKKAAEGRRINQDIEAGHEGMRNLLYHLSKLQRKQKAEKKKVYSPAMNFCLGNHEQRLERHINSNAELDGFLNFPDSFDLHLYGWDVHPFLQPYIVDGVAYAHYFYQPNTGRAYGGTAHTKLKNIGHTFVMGHVQGLDIATRTTNLGKQQWGIVSGSGYKHYENYKGPQANDHWRGIVMLDNVRDGDFDPRPISLDSLELKYG